MKHDDSISALAIGLTCGLVGLLVASSLAVWLAGYLLEKLQVRTGWSDAQCYKSFFLLLGTCFVWQINHYEDRDYIPGLQEVMFVMSWGIWSFVLAAGLPCKTIWKALGPIDENETEQTP